MRSTATLIDALLSRQSAKGHLVADRDVGGAAGATNWAAGWLPAARQPGRRRSRARASRFSRGPLAFSVAEIRVGVLGDKPPVFMDQVRRSKHTVAQAGLGGFVPARRWRLEIIADREFETPPVPVDAARVNDRQSVRMPPILAPCTRRPTPDSSMPAATTRHHTGATRPRGCARRAPS
jgi:hypothetical protein